MPLTLPLVLAISTGLIVLVACVGFLALKRSRQQIEALQSTVDILGSKIDECEHQVKITHENLHEVHAGSLGVGNKVKDLTLQLDRINAKLEEVSNLDPDTRLYTKATRLVNEGASIDELMQECDLPRAEAELLMSLRKN